MLLLLLISWLHLSLAWQMFDWSVAQPQQHSPWFWTLTPFFLPQESTSADANDSKVEEVKEEAVETEDKNAYDGLPRGLLKCQVCDKEMWDGVVYIFWPLTNTVTIWVPNIWIPSMGVCYSNGKVAWLGGPFKYRTFWIIKRVFSVRFSDHHWNTGPFYNRAQIYHFNSSLVRYSDGYCKNKKLGLENQ